MLVERAWFEWEYSLFQVGRVPFQVEWTPFWVEQSLLQMEYSPFHVECSPFWVEQSLLQVECSPFWVERVLSKHAPIKQFVSYNEDSVVE